MEKKAYPKILNGLQIYCTRLLRGGNNLQMPLDIDKLRASTSKCIFCEKDLKLAIKVINLYKRIENEGHIPSIFNCVTKLK